MKIWELTHNEIAEGIGDISWSDKEDILYYPYYLIYLKGFSKTSEQKEKIQSIIAKLLKDIEEEWERFDITYLPVVVRASQMLHFANRTVRFSTSIWDKMKRKYYVDWLLSRRKSVPMSFIIQDMIYERNNGELDTQKDKYLNAELTEWVNQIKDYGMLKDPSSNRAEDIRRATILLEEKNAKNGIDVSEVLESISKQYLDIDYSKEDSATLFNYIGFLMNIRIALNADFKDKYMDLYQAIILHPNANRYLKETAKLLLATIGTKDYFLVSFD